MKRQEVTALIFLSLVQGMVFLDNAIVNIALPSIQETLHISTSSLQWVITAYTLSLGGFLLLGGRTADLFGRKRVLLMGLIIFLLSSVGIGLATNSTQVIILRVIQGLAAGFMSPSALSLVLTLFKGKQRAKALAAWSAVGSVGAALGLSLGGIITQHFGWPWIFFLNIPLGVAAFWGIYTFIPSQPEGPSQKPDWLGALLVTSSLLCLVLALTKASEVGWTQNSTLLSMCVSGLLLLGFIYQEKRSAQPLVPLKIFRNRNLVAGNLAMIGIAASLYGMLFFASLYIQNILQYSPAHSGLNFLLFPAMVALSSFFAPLLLQKLGVKILAISGISLVIVGTYSMTFITDHGSFFTTIFPGLVCMAAGLGVTYLAINTAVTQGVAGHLSGLTSGLISTAQQIGSAIGLAILSGLSASVAATALNNGASASTALVASYQVAFWGVTFCGIFALCMSWFISTRRTLATAPILTEEQSSTS